MKNIVLISVFFFLLQTSQSQDLEKVKEFNTNPGGNSFPHNLVITSNKLFCLANDNTNFSKLWVTGGTDASTQLLGPATATNGTIRNLVSYNNKVYFSCDDGVNGQELWVSDGTVAGTKLFKDLYPGVTGSFPQGFTVANNKLFFMAGGVDGERRLYVSDGTVAGTVIIRNNYIDFFNGLLTFAILNNDIYFIGDDGTGSGYGLWKSNGTPGGTLLVSKELIPGVSGCNYAVLGNKLYFSGFDYTNGSELWVTDGTNAGTHMVKNLATDAGGVLSSGAPQNLQVYNSKIYFAGRDDTHGAELFVTDGTSAGTLLVKDILPGPDGSVPPIIVFNGLLYLINTRTQELWKSDGTAAGTLLVKAITPYSQFAAVWNSKLYLTNNFDYSILQSDGSAAGTGPITVENTNNPIASTAGDPMFTEFNAELYFSGQCPVITGGYELVKLTLGSTALKTFTFTGNGNWSNPANWSGGVLPPATILSGYTVIIGGNCILDIAQHIQSGASLTVLSGKSLVITGSLTP